MNKLFLTLSGIALVTGACAQQNKTAMKYAEIVSPELANKHLSIIASDAYEGRETGKPGADKAAHYIATEFKAQGLQPVANGSYLFNVPLEEKSLNFSLAVNATAFNNTEDFYATSFAEDRKLDVNDIVFVGYGTPAEI